MITEPDRPRDHLLDDRALAARWGIHEVTPRLWRKKGVGPAYVRLGRRVLYRRDTIERYERANEVAPRPSKRRRS